MGYLAKCPRRLERRRGYLLAEVVIALGVAATGIVGALSAISVGTSVSRDGAAMTRAANLGRTILASPRVLAVDRGHGFFSDAGGFELRDSPSSDSVFAIQIERCRESSPAAIVPLCVTISWDEGRSRLRFMTTIRTPEAKGAP